MLQRPAVQMIVGVLVILLCFAAVEALGVCFIVFVMHDKMNVINWVATAPMAGILVIVVAGLLIFTLMCLLVAAEQIGASVAKKLTGEK